MIETERLILRRWRPEDLDPFAEMNADPAVMEFFPGLLTRAESDALAARADGLFDERGYGLFAVEVRGGPAFIGFVGLGAIGADIPADGDAEVGWRLAQAAWGYGFATEAALASLEFGFRTCGLRRIVSFTSAINLRSQQVMRRIGLRRDPGADFEHPRVAAGSPLRAHVLYGLTATEWAAAGSSSAASS